jgi:hypothetical protein
MPDPNARSCGRNFPFDGMPAPFKEGTPNWWSLQ